MVKRICVAIRPSSWKPHCSGCPRMYGTASPASGCRACSNRLQQLAFPLQQRTVLPQPPPQQEVWLAASAR